MEMQAFVGEEKIMKMNAELAMRRDFTVEDIENLPEGVRAELIDGQIFYFAAPKVIHQRLSKIIFMKIANYIEANNGTCEVLYAPVAVRLVEDGKNQLEPDIVVICNADLLELDGCHGAPDWVIEVISKSTKARDYGIKMVKYREAGVKEYWIVDPEREIVLVYWFEDEKLNTIYGFCDEIESRLFPGLKVTLTEK